MAPDEDRIVRGLFAAADVARDEQTVIQRLFHEVWNEGNVAAIDELVAPTAVVFQSDLTTALGPDAYREAVRLLHTAFPDLRVTIEDLVACPGRVVVRWTVRGSHQGPFGALPPTGKAVTMARVSIFRLAAGMVVEEWCGGDVIGLKEQVLLVLGGSERR